MIVLVCGSRDWTDRETIRRWIGRLPRDTVIVHGDNGERDPGTGQAIRGADRIAGDAAFDRGMTVRTYPANWDVHGKAAGPIRNQHMIDTEKPDRVFAFTEALTRDKGGALTPTGTTDCVMRALAAGIPCTLIPSKGSRWTSTDKRRC